MVRAEGRGVGVVCEGVGRGQEGRLAAGGVPERGAVVCAAGDAVAVFFFFFKGWGAPGVLPFSPPPPSSDRPGASPGGGAPARRDRKASISSRRMIGFIASSRGR